jgi:hypothetical protein
MNAYGFPKINYNSFSPLFDYNVVCYKCKKNGYKEHFFRNNLVETPRQNKVVVETFYKMTLLQ